MDMITPAVTRTYEVRVDYLSEGEPFARDTFTIEVVDGIDPYDIARARADRHPYANGRIPGLSLGITLRPQDPEDPEPRPPSGALIPICPQCGGDALVRDASACWDSASQDWTLAGVQDCETCDLCGVEGDDLARWVPAPSEAPADHYLRALAAALGEPGLIEDVHFQRFCLDVHASMTVERAASRWQRQPSVI